MPTPVLTVLVLGASGRFGHAAVQAFAAGGHRVLAQSRQSMSAPAPGVEMLRFAPTDAALAERVAGVDVVVHAVNPPYDRWEAEAVPLAQAAIALAARAGARLMMPGNVYGYGESMPTRLDEATPRRPSSAKGRIRESIEALIARQAREEGLAATIVRAGDFYGSGTGSWLDLSIAKSIASGRLVYPGPRDLEHAWAYLPDLARVFVALAEAPPRPGLETFGFAGHTLTGDQLLDALERCAHALGIGPAGAFKRGSVPWPLLRLASVFVPVLRGVVEMSYLWRVPHRIDGQALLERLGRVPDTPVDQALTASLRALASRS